MNRPLRAGVGALGMALSAAAAAKAGASAEPERCRVQVELEPTRAVVGQQVHYRLRILRRRDVERIEWETPLSFPTFRTEWLPGVALDRSPEADGETWLEVLERRAIFPVHPGALTVPAAGLRCSTHDGEEVVRIPSRALVVEEAPAEGRPPGFAGLLGPVTLESVPSAQRMTHGGTLRLRVVLEGETNLWSAASPRAALETVPELDVFPQSDHLARDAGRRLWLRRYWSFDLVPRHAGTLFVPELRFAYFDTGARRYAEALAPGHAIVVEEGDAPEPSAAARTERGAERPPRRSMAALLAALFVAVFAGGVGVAVVRAGRLRWKARARSEAADLGAAHSAALRGDRDGLARESARALRTALAARIPEAAALPAEELASRAGADVPAATAAQLVVRLDAARFAPGALVPELAEVEAALRALREPSSGGR